MFEQLDMDDYWDVLYAKDAKQEYKNRESKSVKMMRKAALKFYLVDCLNQKINLKRYSNKSVK